MDVNGQDITEHCFKEERIHLPAGELKVGEQNTVTLRFTSSYVRDCQGVHWYRDKEDGSEYIYSESEPFSQHKGFPCFDQPDIKASLTFMAIVPQDWIVCANQPEIQKLTARTGRWSNAMDYHEIR